jgi:hypothetical protein
VSVNGSGAAFQAMESVFNPDAVLIDLTVEVIAKQNTPSI